MNLEQYIKNQYHMRIIIYIYRIRSDKDKLNHFQKSIQLEDDIRRVNMLDKYLHAIRRNKQFSNIDV